MSAKISSSHVQIKRAYAPAAAQDGTRILTVCLPMAL